MNHSRLQINEVQDLNSKPDSKPVLLLIHSSFFLLPSSFFILTPDSFIPAVFILNG